MPDKREKSTLVSVTTQKIKFTENPEATCNTAFEIGSPLPNLVLYKTLIWIFLSLFFLVPGALFGVDVPT